MTDQQAKHTPIPWAFKDGDTIIGPSGNIIAECCGYSVKATANDQRKQGGREANAALIVDAVNSYMTYDHRPLLEQVADIVSKFKTQKGEFIADRIRIRYSLGKYRKY